MLTNVLLFVGKLSGYTALPGKEECPVVVGRFSSIWPNNRILIENPLAGKASWKIIVIYLFF